MPTHRTVMASLCLAVALAAAAVAAGAEFSRVDRAAATTGCGNATCPPSSPATTETPTPTLPPPQPASPSVAPESVAPTAPTPETTLTVTPTPDAAPATASLPYIIEGPPPDVIEQIRAGKVPNVTLADLARLQQNALGAPALAGVNQAAPAGTPIVGTDHGIAILAQYADLAASPGSTQSFFQSMLFGTGPGSMRTYYGENSYNQYDIQGDVTNWVTVAHNRDWYADYDGVPNSTALCGFGDDYGCGSDPAHSSQTLIRDAVLAADPSVDFSAYATDGVVRNLMIIHAGPGAEANTSCRTCAWSVAWGPAASLVVDGVSIQSAFVAPEYTYTPGDSKIGVYAHEFGHLAFGLPDLYDTDYSSAGVGYWSLMGSGSWLNGGATPAHLDAWSKIHNGWLTPTVISADGVANIPAAETSATALKLWTNGAPGNEYFLVENRQQTGFDAYLPGSGLLIWHVDDSVYSNNADCHPHVLLIPADSGVSLPCSGGYGGASTPWPGTLFRTNWNGATVPGSRSYLGTQSGVAVMSISLSAPTMTANVSVSNTTVFNDNIASATDILGTPFSETLDTAAATVEFGEPAPCGSIGKTLWYRYTPVVSPPSPVEFTVDTAGSNFDTVLAVYAATGPSSPPGGLSLVDCNDNASGLGNLSRITFTAVPGNTYYLQAGGAIGASGSLVFNANLGPPRGSISGMVVDQNAIPIAGAQVSASPIGCCGPGSPVLTDANGEYAISGLLPGDYTLYAIATGFAGQYFSGTYHYYEATNVTVAGGADTPGIDFVLEPAARISGTVTDELGTPVAGAWIYAENAVCCDGGAWTSTAPDGTYLLDTLAPGSYRLRASAPGFAGEYYDDTYDFAAAALIVASSGAETIGIDFALAAGARISGTVTNALGTPIAYAFVAADRDGGGGTGYTSSGVDGTYLIDALTSGNYRVYAQAPGYERQFYSGAHDEASATLVATSSGGETPGIDFVLLEGGKISGTITNALGTPIAGAYVTAERDGGGGYGGAFTGVDGTYLIDSLSAGDYRVGASASGYLNTYYNGEVFPWFATLVSVSTGAETSAINIALQQAGRMSGTVTDLLGTPIAGAQLYAERAEGYWANVVFTSADGTYLFDNMPPGTYRVSASAAGHLAQYYDGADDWNAATLVAVSAGAETNGIDFALPDGARISGTVENALGTPIAGAFVAAELDGGYGDGGYAWSGADGSYLIDTLRSGDYRVHASASGYPTQYYDGVYDIGAATLVGASLGVETPGIDFALAEGGRISGTVTNALGTPIAGAYVSAAHNNGLGYGGAYTAADGAYLIVGLAGGDYRVRASASGYPAQFYDGVTDWSLATPVGVSLGAETTGIDFALPEGGKISGTVRDTYGAPIAGAYVTVERDGGYGYGSTYAAADGTYVIDTLPPGNYRVYASATDYPGQYYDGTYDWSAATLVAASSGVEASGIDFALTIGGKISGTVTNQLGTPIAGAWVSANLDVCCGGSYAIAAADGTYTIRGLKPGSYRVASSASGYVEQYYNGTHDWSAATLVATSSGTETTGIDFVLERTGKMSGTVLDALGGPIGDAWVYATEVGGTAGRSTYTAPDGTYMLSDLPPGTYRVEAQKAGFAWQFYDGTSDASAATLVGITSGAETTGIDFTLVVGARISGKVTNSLGTPIAGAWVAAAQDGGFGGGSAGTGSDGLFTIDTLLTGNYQVSAWANGYGTQYWDHVEDAGSATLVPATSGLTTPNIDFSLLPPNPDHSWTPKDILAFPFTDSRSTAAASLDPGETQPCGDLGATIWYRLAVPYSPPGTTTITVDTTGSDFDTAVAVYAPDYSTPSPPGGLTLIGCNAGGLRSWQTFAAAPGSIFYIQVGGQSGATGNLVVNADVDDDADGLRDPVETDTGVYVDVSDTGTDPALVDTDGDACGDGHEVLHWGLNPTNAWDLYSVPLPNLLIAADPTLSVRPRTISASNAQAVFAYFKRFAKTGSPEYEQDLNLNGIKDGIEYDRSFVSPGVTGPPDGTIGASDAQLAFAQFKLGYHC